jgi:hypothetical protein
MSLVNGVIFDSPSNVRTLWLAGIESSPDQSSAGRLQICRLFRGTHPTRGVRFVAAKPTTTTPRPNTTKIKYDSGPPLFLAID